MMVRAHPSVSGSFVSPARPRGIWGPLLVAFVTEAAILAATLFWLSTRPSAPVPSAFGPLRLDLTMPATIEPAATAPRQPPPAPSPPPQTAEIAPAAPPEAEAAAKTEKALPPEPAPAQAEETAKWEESPPVQAIPAPTPPRNKPDAQSEHRPAKALSQAAPRQQSMPELESIPLPDLSLLPRDDAAHNGPRQAAPRLANGQVDRLSAFYQQLNAALNAAAHDLGAGRGQKPGRVQIAVHYRDGKAWGAWIVQSSGSPAFDQVVLDGVTRAVWPSPPPGLEGREIIVPIVGSFW